MKKLVLALALGFGMSTAVFAQDNVPEQVKTNFNNSYAQASDVEWEAKDDTYYAKFEMNGNKHWIKFNADGTVKKQGREIEVSELPQAVRNAISQQYANRTIEKAKTVEKDGQTRYMAKLDGDDEDLKVVFNADGSVEKEMDKDKDKNKRKY
ncbi:PepSY-like domain-containing protein [Pontibacter virosus]|uniref:Putative PepSY-like beta-lactamase-inhibitor n=1 Tax=Pontibacter virosus TaxID=1765052 RepID=A0A2U1ATI1_9BACT|nr:PepSY-like domain-containing protein [Pontibacter virosus]PVY39693.1 putative PepSY-like beta-lactamase-inhibitor [Pontibacter virosus]